jgi:inorganic pyrophosphatase
VEISRGSCNKHEYDADAGFLEIDRVLFSSLHYPGDYGFVLGTPKANGDPLAVLVMTNEPSFSGCVIEARPLGVFRLMDKGEYGPKILAVPHAGPLFGKYRDLDDVPRHFRAEAGHFFSAYKDLEMARGEARGWEGQRRKPSGRLGRGWIAIGGTCRVGVWTDTTEVAARTLGSDEV